MSFEFGQFESNRGADPTSEFLQRERLAAGDLLGDDQALFGSAVPGRVSDDVAQRSQAFPALDDEAPFEDAVSTNLGTPDVPQAAPGAQDDTARFEASFPALRDEAPASEEERFQASFPALDSKAPASEEERFQASFPPLDSKAPASEEERFQTSFPPLDGEAPAPREPAESLGVPDERGGPVDEAAWGVAPAAPAEPVSAQAPAPTPFSYGDLEEDTAPLRAWQAEQAEAIAQREARAERQRAEAVSQAEQDIDQFYAEYNAQKEKNIKKNKEAEVRFREQMQQELAEGTTWTRITKLLDLQNSQSKTIAKGGPGSTDLTRLKELYLHLRREGDRAPGAAGY
ncbi:unnamed protein product [Malassezia sympodialis ATCC 42132]|uniref:Clathrin light chain n=1 Tax=Malassezia sympodialis (strain ATCC 42132) TaxID=1230383 RepID=M5EB93_MALS4|nr:uncharacterized protein MSY001_2368 [Malassezia sympodialis ATCC 42132]CCU99662.1 unnamed protein product [Malassezia sympodialis ATCC 42132]SHO76862.1 Similar to S.cerevisiae protein CLC1 (Clathrin light chain) [Malassezia sympodialis ATCC 42132]|eukprot:XP_018740897.1 uncharacterized protein MSY001_2368 [Malassezia sympodialis ATCC 42132]